MKILALSEANILSFHSIALIAAAEEKGINALKISELTNCSRNHLFKVLESLVKAGLIYSTRGPRGGYFLNKPADTIYLLDVFEALNGKVDENEICIGRNRNEKSFIFFEQLCQELTNKFLNYLKNTKIADLKDHAGKIL
ncbi:MAG: Rrf2 family transcriptional regulator [Bacteroidales bacterium]|nr:Rrf2 family transcriptional regulator [Bacteroidales bacterium]MDD4217754.1 Rrf2 family transcriptional regulator [Bacteroidales bacterium]MDY0142169.1 Rrf2 family transcriptional regulator [Bacteroidales bacterium]